MTGFRNERSYKEILAVIAYVQKYWPVEIHETLLFRKLQRKLILCAGKSLTKLLQVNIGKRYGIPCIVLSIQTFGDYARWVPHPLGLERMDCLLKAALSIHCFHSFQFQG